MTASNELTAAGHAYIARLYEAMVDKDYDLEQIRAALERKGIKRNIYQVEYDLTHRYEFYGYAQSHQPKPRLTLAELKAKEALDESKVGRVRMLDGSYARPAAH